MLQGWAWISLESTGKYRVDGMQGWLYTRPTLPSKSMQAFIEQVSNFTKSHFNITMDPQEVDLAYSITLFDSIMLWARAATKVLLAGGNLFDGAAVTAAVRSTTFEGVGGSSVVLDKHGDRIESYEIMSYIAGADNGIMGSVPIGLCNSTVYTSEHKYTPVVGLKYTPYEQAVVWPGRMAETPISFIQGPRMHAHALEPAHMHIYPQ